MNMTQEIDKKLVGRVEKLAFPELGFNDIHARIDTGARTSALWVSEAIEKDGKLSVIFFGPGSKNYSGQIVKFDQFDKTVVANSTGHTQIRYKIRLLVRIKGKKIRAWFTLADRSTQVYPVLIGRNVLLGKFIVDVIHGQALKSEERKRTEALRTKLERTED